MLIGPNPPIPISNHFNYPELEQITFENGSRYYLEPTTGNRLYSVTTILDATEDKTALLEWKKFVGEDRARRISKQATDLGSLMHTHVECHLAGIDRPSARTPPRILAKEMADRIINQALPHVSEVWGIETRQYVPGLFAGTCDLVGIYKGKPTIIDHKSSKKMKTKSKIVNYRDQMAAYVLGHNEVYGTNIEHAAVFMSTRDGDYKTFEYGPDEIRDGKASFIQRLETFLGM